MFDTACSTADGPRPPREECFDLAWEALRAGSDPVGAAIVNTDAVVVARSRSRSQEALARGEG